MIGDEAVLERTAVSGAGLSVRTLVEERHCSREPNNNAGFTGRFETARKNEATLGALARRRLISNGRDLGLNGRSSRAEEPQ